MRAEARREPLRRDEAADAQDVQHERLVDVGDGFLVDIR